MTKLTTEQMVKALRDNWSLLNELVGTEETEAIIACLKEADGLEATIKAHLEIISGLREELAEEEARWKKLREWADTGIQSPFLIDHHFGFELKSKMDELEGE